jgi:hypothetical protein
MPFWPCCARWARADSRLLVASAGDYTTYKAPRLLGGCASRPAVAVRADGWLVAQLAGVASLFY